DATSDNFTFAATSNVLWLGSVGLNSIRLVRHAYCLPSCHALILAWRCQDDRHFPANAPTSHRRHHAGVGAARRGRRLPCSAGARSAAIRDMNSASTCQPTIGAARTRPTTRLLVVIDGYEVTGPAKQLLAAHARLARELRTTIAVIQRGPEETPLLTAVRATGLPLTVLRERFRFDPAPAVALACHARRIGADIIQTHGYKANVFAALVSKVVRVPWVAFLH